MIIGSLGVKITADTTDLHGGLNRARRFVRDGATELRGYANQWTKWGAAATAASAVAAAAIYRSTAQQIDQLAKTSEKLGIATEQLAGLRFAAEQTGIAQNTLDMALQRMTRRVAEAAQGTGEAVKAIDELGLSAVDLAQKTPDEALRDIADAMQSVENESDRLRLAFKLFDSEGAGLVNTLAGGSAALDDFQSQAEALGIAISSVDAAQVEAANDAINRAQKAIQGVAQQVTVELAPIIEALADEFTQAAISGEGVGGHVEAGLEKAIGAVKFMADALRGVEVVAAGLKVAFAGVGEFITYTFTSIYEGWQRIFAEISGGLIAIANQANRIPGVNIPTEGLEAFRASSLAQVEAMEDAQRVAREATAAAVAGFQELAMVPMPSEGIQAFVDEVKAKAAEISNTMQSAMSGGEVGENGQPVNRFAELQAQFEAENALRQQQFMTDAEIAAQNYATKLEMLRTALQNEQLTREEFAALAEQAAAGHADNMVAIESNKASQISDLNSRLGGELVSILGNFGSAGLKVQKAVSSAMVVVQTAQGVSAELARLNYAGAALQAAKGAAQLSTIKSAQVGGGAIRSISTAGAATSLPAAPVAQPSQPAQQERRTMIFDIRGDDVFSADTVRRLIGSINEQIGDGVELRTA